jgi:hypothetical protein
VGKPFNAEAYEARVRKGTPPSVTRQVLVHVDDDIQSMELLLDSHVEGGGRIVEGTLDSTAGRVLLREGASYEWVKVDPGTAPRIVPDPHLVEVRGLLTRRTEERVLGAMRREQTKVEGKEKAGVLGHKGETTGSAGPTLVEAARPKKVTRKSKG